MSKISIITLLILTLVIGYAFAYPSFGDLSALTAEKQKYSDSLDMISNIENKKNELLTEFNNISAADRKSIETILPNSLDFVELVSQIDAVAAGYGISIDKVYSKDKVASAGKSIEEAAPQKPYQSAIVGFSFNASYEKFNAFMNSLEKSLRILDIKSIKLETQDSGIYTYNVEFETYWMK